MKPDRLILKHALFIHNHSGGKDSQKMFLELKRIIPRERLIVIHATLGMVEWEGTISHIENTTKGYDLRIAQAGKTFFDMVEHRRKWPSPKNRQCTSDLKRGPIEKTIRHLVKEKNNSLVVNCMGLRAEESVSRAKKKVFALNKRNSKAGREWYDWLPIHETEEREVFGSIRRAGEKPHFAYEKGMSRLSCRFCIMASKEDLCRSAQLNPELYSTYCRMERELDFSFCMPGKKGVKKFLPEITGINPN